MISGLVSDPATQDVVDAILGSATKDLISQTLWVSFFAAPTSDGSTVVVGMSRLPMDPDGAARVARGALPGPRHTSPRYGVAAWVVEAGSLLPLQATGGMLSP